MPYRLKPTEENFQVVDGPFAGRRYVAGTVYGEVPPGEEARFVAVDHAQPETKKTKKQEPSRTVSGAASLVGGE